MPPADEILDALKFIVLLPAAVGAAVFALFSYLRQPRLGFVIALVAAFLVANEYRSAVDFRLDSEKPLTFADGKAAATAALTSDKTAAHRPPARYWLPWVLLLAGVVGLIADAARMPRLVATVLRVIISAVIAHVLTSKFDPDEARKLCFATAAAIAANWHLLQHTLRRHPGWIASFTVALAFQLAGTLLLYSHSARLADIAVILGSAAFAAAVIACWRKQSAAAVAPFLATALPALALVGGSTHSSEVPTACFFLVAFAPLLLIVNLLRPRRDLILLMLVPLIVAVVLAARVENLAVAAPEW